MQAACKCLGTRAQFWAPTVHRCRVPPARRLVVRNVGWDPEGILAPPKGGHISRRQLQRQVAEDEDLKKQVEAERQMAREELIQKREGRKTPASHAELVEYFMETESEEMEYEMARRRPLITPEFLSYLSDQIGEERFSNDPNQGRLDELEALRDVLQKGVQAIDTAAKQIAAPLDRMRKLLTAPDKKAMLLEMAGNNEIDQALLNLLKQNIAAARAAGQEDPAKFMEKIHDAARKYLIT
ncbi:hypothetical protein WJX72_011080 [[Myrmecia] bisecta]|uniref:Uncharacterized protein n=1 Tax=[Myrmecia] bisecta TaxID=41462 RepID=A0AAW1QGF6_9CHLO